MVAPPASPIPPNGNALSSLNEVRLNNVEEALKIVKSCCQAMEENAKKQTVMIKGLTNLIQTQNKNLLAPSITNKLLVINYRQTWPKLRKTTTEK